MIDFPNLREVPTRAAIHELLDFVDEVIDDLGSRQEMTFLRQVLEGQEGIGADRQLAMYEQTGDVVSVTRWLTQATMQGIMPADTAEDGPDHAEQAIDLSGAPLNLSSQSVDLSSAPIDLSSQPIDL